MSKDDFYEHLKAKVEGIRAHYVEYDYLTRIKWDIRRLQERDNAASEGGCMAIFGPSGSGKSKLIDDYMTGFPREPKGIVKPNGDYADRVPVLYVKARDTSLKSLTEMMYEALTREKPDGRRFDIENDIYYFAREMGVKLVIFDEAHETIDDRTAKTTRAVSRFFKDLANAGLFSMLFVGTDDARRLIESSDELDRRTLVTRELKPFEWDVEDRRDIFLAILAEFDEELQSAFGHPVGLAREDLAVRIHAATRGLVGEMARLIENAGIEAVYDVVHGRADRMTEEHLARGFDIGASRKRGQNPFKVAAVEPWRPVVERPLARRRTRRANQDDHFRP